MKNLYRGTLVRLCSETPETLVRSSIGWDRDSEARRLGGIAPMRLWSEKKLREIVDANESNQEHSFRFAIRTLAEDKLIGTTSLWIEDWNHSEAWFGIFIGDRDCWDQGYGTDTTRLVVQYGFCELNLRRISLGLHSYNERALRSYLKVGFQLEGRARGEGLRDGVRFDGLCMGLLREEWKEMDHDKITDSRTAS